MFDNRSRAALPRERFFDVMAAFPTGVAVVTTLDADGSPRGLSSSAFCSVSADPPLVLVCLDRGSRTLRAVSASRRFAANFLRAETDRVCGVFASKSDSKFDCVAWRAGETGMPILEDDALAYMECQVEQELAAGDHVIVVGRAIAADVREGEPLVYHRRAYGRFTPFGGAQAR